MRRRMFKRSEAESQTGLDIGALAPMVDMMTLLLVFLLRTYSSEPAPMPPEGQFELPNTAAQDPRRPAVTILVGREAIYVDGDRMIATKYLPEDLLVTEIYDRLLASKGMHRVEVHADHRVSYGALKRVLHTASAAGFDEISLVGSVEAGF